jgi:hypothetical protein
LLQRRRRWSEARQPTVQPVIAPRMAHPSQSAPMTTSPGEHVVDARSRIEIRLS